MMYDKLSKCIIGIMSLLCASSGVAQQKTDSVIINVGTGKVIILVDDPDDLQELANYDLNAVLKELRIKLSGDSALISKNEKPPNDTTIATDRPEYEAWENEEQNRQDKTEDDGTVTKRGNSRHFIHFDLGINDYLHHGDFPEETNAQYAVRPWGSWYFSINSVHQKYLTDRFYVEMGPGISWYNFKFQDDRTLVTEVDGITTFTEDPDPERSYKKSKLTAAFLNVSVVPMFQLGSATRKKSIDCWVRQFPGKEHGSKSGLRFGIGGYAGYRLGSRSKVKYKGGEKDKDRDDFNLSNIRYGVRIQVGFKGTDLFFNYDVNELFNEDKGPDLNAFSFGITF